MSLFGPDDPSRPRRLWMARSALRDPLDPHHWTPSPVLPPVPRRFCDPVQAFGDPGAPERTWLPPVDSSRVRDWSEFRKVVLQHAICIAVRRDPDDGHGLTRPDDQPHGTHQPVPTDRPLAMLTNGSERRTAPPMTRGGRRSARDRG
jgi:hypothetical protein